ncbi:hypothetical protein LSCM4_02901 [Leishmania orientalis]|uniref:Uncharacterized protein n=1 Tax=Leishmania orientalis TaxID=2249476 RepID=A0A836GM25_9TRYP|nr:hypothetical protein LSCM4_02901 [Leishmania orientalis]
MSTLSVSQRQVLVLLRPPLVSSLQLPQLRLLMRAVVRSPVHQAISHRLKHRCSAPSRCKSDAVTTFSPPCINSGPSTTPTSFAQTATCCRGCGLQAPADPLTRCTRRG